MLSLSRYEIVTGSRPGKRDVYARLSTGELRRLQPPGEKAVLLQYDLQNANKEHTRMRINKKLFIFAAVAAGMLILALTVNFPSF